MLSSRPVRNLRHRKDLFYIVSSRPVRNFEYRTDLLRLHHRPVRMVGNFLTTYSIWILPVESPILYAVRIGKGMRNKLFQCLCRALHENGERVWERERRDILPDG